MKQDVTVGCRFSTLLQKRRLAGYVHAEMSCQVERALNSRHLVVDRATLLVLVPVYSSCRPAPILRPAHLFGPATRAVTTKSFFTVIRRSLTRGIVMLIARLPKRCMQDRPV